MPTTTGTHTITYPADGTNGGWYSTWSTMMQAISDHMDNLDSTRVNTITDGNGNERLIFGTTASAVNHIQIDNAATGNGPLITAAGGDTNISVRFKGLGTGQVTLGDADLLFPDVDGTSGQILTTDGAGTLTFTSADGETNTSSNVGTGGVGVFKQKTSVDFEFKKINAGSSKITITDDTGNDEVDIDLGTVAAGDLSDLTIAGGSKGDILVYNGSAWVDVTVGANDYVLGCDSTASSGLAWLDKTAGSLRYIDTYTASGATSLEIASALDDTYKQYVLVITDLYSDGGDRYPQIQVSTDNGATWQTSGYTSACIDWDGDDATQSSRAITSGIVMVGDSMAVSSSGLGAAYLVHVAMPTTGSNYTRFSFKGSYEQHDDSSTHMCRGGGSYNSTTDADAVRILMNSGNISLSVALYGIAES